MTKIRGMRVKNEKSIPFARRQDDTRDAKCGNKCSHRGAEGNFKNDTVRDKKTTEISAVFLLCKKNFSKLIHGFKIKIAVFSHIFFDLGDIV